MQVQALKTFQSRYGMVRSGQQFNAEPGYARDLLDKKMIKVVEPQLNQSVPGAPSVLDDEKKSPSGTAVPPAGGQGRRSSASPVVRASRRKTSTRLALKPEE